MQEFVSLVCFLFAFASLQAQEREAEARLFSRALRFEPAFIGLGGESQLVLGTAPENGEVLPSRSVFDLESAFLLDIPETTIGGTIDFDLPDFSDANGNAVNDFYEVGQSVEEATTTGIYATWDQLETGTVTVIWRRDGGSRFGTGMIQMTSVSSGPFPEFSHQFELIEYTGTLTYTVGEMNVSGEMALIRSGNPSATLQSEMTFSNPPFPIQDLFFGATAEFLNESNQSLVLDVATFLLNRDGQNYSGDVEFADGNLTSGFSDFNIWGLVITDPNDEDSDGIPDLSDREFTENPPLPPVMSIRVSGNAVVIEIIGEAGRSYSLESTASAFFDDWHTEQIVSMVTDSEAVEFQISEGAAVFWRARSQ